MYIRAHMCVCPRVVNPSTGLGGVGEAPFFVSVGLRTYVESVSLARLCALV